MKTQIAIIALAALAAACGSTPGSRAVSGAVLGGAAGAAIGNNVGDGDAGRGAAIGAVGGAIAGAATTPSSQAPANRRERYDERTGRNYFYDPGTGRYCAAIITRTASRIRKVEPVSRRRPETAPSRLSARRPSWPPLLPPRSAARKYTPPDRQRSP
jgi:hypothetical protein